MPSNKPNISELGEKKLIERLLSRSHNSIPNSPFFKTFFDEFSLKSLEDDAALLSIGDNYLVVTSDLLLEPSHFPPLMNAREIGKKSVIVNLSDLAAMGARPIGIIMSMGLPPDLPLEDFDSLLEGILEACDDYDLALLGGDTNQADDITLCGTAIGIVDKNKVLMKSGAQKGDLVAVTGDLGLAAAGLELILGTSISIDLNPLEKEEAIKHALRPRARVEEGLMIASSGAATSATDITDGLLSEMGEITKASKVGIRFYENKLPIQPIVNKVASIFSKSSLEMAISYGEDFELLLTIKKDEVKSLKNLVAIQIIGEVTDSGRIEMINKDGNTNILVSKGYEHLKIINKEK
ncbi:MAG TPA: thiamine-phosphate kinase [Methanobacteriaceae archaeon]|nr:thiamine-phosphate kinase [Methanobacteriaceae archaeon]